MLQIATQCERHPNFTVLKVEKEDSASRMVDFRRLFYEPEPQKMTLSSYSPRSSLCVWRLGKDVLTTRRWP
eukprot:scaffold1610_cov257-Pinguiococcus_pyrenoidosus.AAC.65